MKLLFYWNWCETNCFFFYLEQFMFWAWRCSSVLGYFLLPVKQLQPQRPLSGGPANTHKIALSFPKTFSTVNYCFIFLFLCFHHGFNSFLPPVLSCFPSTAWGRANVEQQNFRPQQTPSLTNPHPVFPLVLSPRIEPINSWKGLTKAKRKKVRIWTIWFWK